jgi:aspartate racemase
MDSPDWPYAAQAVRVPVWNLIDITLAEVAAGVGTGSTLGMLASTAVRRVELYERHGKPFGMRTLYPAHQAEILAVIKAVKARRTGDREIAAFNHAARQLANAGAQSIVLACTELSLIADRLDAGVPVFDSLQVLAEHIVATAKA